MLQSITFTADKGDVMKQFSRDRLADLIRTARKEKDMKQQELADATGIHRAMLSHIERKEYTPSIAQLEALANALSFDISDVFEEVRETPETALPSRNIAVAGTGYVGLSLAVLLSQKNHVTAVDIIPEKVDLINQRRSPIQDTYIEQYLQEKTLDLTAVTDGREAYRNADYIIIATPTNYDPKKNYFDTSAVESVIELVLEINRDKAPEDMPVMIIKSTIPVGYTESLQEKYHSSRILFSPEFLRESKALYDNLYPSRIIVGCDTADPGGESERPHGDQEHDPGGLHRGGPETLWR
jgi:UDPglucose 6-dehydrogenase